MITFYDIPSNLSKAFSPSPNTWKIRYALNYKNVEYRTVWIEYPDIAQLYKKLDISAALLQADGSPYYTLPLIQDDTTGEIITNSIDIARYLDEAYRDAPVLFPLGRDSHALHAAFSAAFTAKLPNLFRFALPAMYEKLNPRSQAYFKPTKESNLGKSFEELSQLGPNEWAKVKADFGAIAGWIGKGKFVVGERLSYADMELAGFVLWMRVVFGEESERWQDVKTWDGGKWVALLKALERYESVKI